MKTFTLQAKIAVFGLLALVSAGTLFTARAHAQQTVTNYTYSSSSCVQLQSNMWLGSYDGYGSTGQVSMLQNYLIQAGYMNHAPTGYFGGLTFLAVQRFQASNGILSSGYVGPLTRAQIQALSCQGTNPNPTPVPAFQVPYINSINPTSGTVGSTVTIMGSGFSAIGNTVFFSGGAIQNVPAFTLPSYNNGIVCQNYPNCTAQQQMTFTVPSSVAPYCQPGYACAQYMRLVTPGTYPVYVTNSAGTSNTYNFTVLDVNANSQLSILGLDAPSSLPVNNMGTWTVRVSSQYQGTLHYSVQWGDQPLTSNAAAALPYSGSTQNSATFTHAYSYTGSFTPVFTVTDDYGHSVTATATVQVTPIY